MLIRFYIDNCLSFKERTEFNMVSGKYKRHETHLVHHKELKILKYASLYGPNASGKSNFIECLKVLSSIILDGTKDKKEMLPYNPFKLNADNAKKPTSFEIDFLVDNIIYSYFIKYTENIILEEWLYILKNDSTEVIFERITDINTNKNSLKLNKKLFADEELNMRIKIYEDDLRENQPFIFEANNKNLEYIKDAYNWFDKKLHILSSPDVAVKGLVSSMVKDKEFRTLFNEFIHKAGLGLDKVSIKEKELNEYFSNDTESKEKKKIESILRVDDKIDWMNDSGKFIAAYKNNDNILTVGELELLHLDNSKDYIDLGIYAESRGTIRLIHLLPAFINISLENIVLVMDEIETSFHPLLTSFLLKFIFKNNKDSNGQLIFSTHMSSLLDLNTFRQDEIWFFDKKESQESVISPLSEFKVRFDLDIQRKYLEGKLGSIPCLKDL